MLSAVEVQSKEHKQNNLALIEVKILFLIALGLNPRQLKKDWNVWQENGK